MYLLAANKNTRLSDKLQKYFLCFSAYSVQYFGVKSLFGSKREHVKVIAEQNKLILESLIAVMDGINKLKDCQLKSKQSH